MTLPDLGTQFRTAWTNVPTTFRYNGGTLVLVGFVLATVHATSTGPLTSRADWTPTSAARDLPPLTHVKLFATPPATQPAGRNLFSLDWRDPSASKRATAADDAGFWIDVATPLNTKPARGGAR